MEYLWQVAPYSGFLFWSLLTLFILSCMALRFLRAKQWATNSCMIAVSVLIIALVQHDNKHTVAPILACLFALTLAVYFTGKILQTDSWRALRFKLLWGSIVLIVLILSYFKYSYFQAWVDNLFSLLVPTVSEVPSRTEGHIFLLGVSYFSFKFIHFLVEAYNKKIKELRLLTFVNYALFFPGFFSGPINRYNAFAANMGSQPLPMTLSDYMEGSKRIINGLVKKVLATLLVPYSTAALNFGDPSVTPSVAVISIYAYMFYIYFDFSGYTDMAIGSARLVGISLPENFNYPFFKRNLQQFWANWHMSLTTWLTDYIYWPLAKKIRHVERLRNNPIAISCISIIVTFVVCGLWHGDGLNFFIWGAYHGVGLAILNVYTQFEKKRFPAKWKKAINATRWGYAMSCLITFQYAAFGFLLFGCDMAKLKAFFRIFSA